MATSVKISGDLNGADYGDNCERSLAEGVYDYTLTAGGNGKLAFKVEQEVHINGDHLGEKAKTRWDTIERKSKIRGDTALSGEFTVTPSLGASAAVRFNFNREFLSNKVSYTLTFRQRS